MNALLIVLTGLSFFYFGYRFYARYLGKRIFRLDDSIKTPAHRFNDGIDFVPTAKGVLFGHHFTSVAGAAPIVGPTIAIYWGWGPAFLWIVLGTVFAAGIHDLGSLVVSVRNDGQSMGTLADKVIGKRAKVLFLFIILILIFMVNAVFAWVIAKLFISFPSSILPVFIQIPLAIWIGYHVYKRKGNILVPSLIALFMMYLSAVLTSYYPWLNLDLKNFIPSEGVLSFSPTEFSFLFWIVVLMVYGYVASVLPVWKLLQPRDFINSHQLILGLGALYLGVLVARPEVNVPFFESHDDKSWFPFLFITIACGAISGFHGLVSSGTSSKQLNKESDAPFVGYLGAVGEGALALISLVAVVSLFPSSEQYRSVYSSFIAAGSQGLGSFIKGSGFLVNSIGVPVEVGKTVVAVIVISFAATSLDTAMRLQRYIINELGHQYGVEPLTRTHVATSIGVIGSAMLAIIPEGPNGFGSGGFLLWPLFGTSNQLLAGITLLILTIWLKKRGSNYIPTLVPMIFLVFMTIWAMSKQLFIEWPGEKNGFLLLVFGSLVLGFAVWIVLEGILIFRSKKEVA